MAQVGPDDVVLEVGPGLGSLTLALSGDRGPVEAVEIDARLADRLPRTAAEFVPEQAHRLTVRCEDAVTCARSRRQPFSWRISPYNTGVPILLTVLEHFPRSPRGGHGAGGGGAAPDRRTRVAAIRRAVGQGRVVGAAPGRSARWAARSSGRP